MKKSRRISFSQASLLEYRILTVSFNKNPRCTSESTENRLSKFDVKIYADKGIYETSSLQLIGSARRGYGQFLFPGNLF
jgi:hypothetical protein